jgi:Thaumarchaeal output domain 1
MNTSLLTRRRKKEPERGSPRRASTRRSVSCNLAVIAIRLDQSPGQIYWSENLSVDESGSGLRFSVVRSEPFATRQLVIGAELGDQKRRFTIATIEDQRISDDELQVDVKWPKSSEDDLFSIQNLTPRIDPTQFQFRYGCDERVLLNWESIGVLSPYLVDRVLVCPECSSIPTLRHACPRCHSARFSRDRLIHHFACANVDRAEAFQSSADSLQCPKCRSTRLIVGVDFEYIDGPLTCFDCTHTGTQPTLSCLCHRCSQRFEPTDSHVLELYGYHLDRLAPLDIVAASE